MIRHHLSKKEIKTLKPVLQEWGITVSKGDRVEIAEEDDMRFVLINGEITLIVLDDLACPTLQMLWKRGVKGKTVKVDEGAVKHVLNGANVFSAGIVDASPDIVPGDVVVVVDPKERPIAIGVAEVEGSRMVSERKGLAVKNIHHLGDRISRIRV